MTNTDLSSVFLEPNCFSGMSVSGNFSLAGSRFKDNLLQTRLFNGLILNRESNGYLFDLSWCGLEVLEVKEDGCTTFYTCQDDNGGPFSGIVTSVGNAGQYVNLSHNRITTVNSTTFNGVGCSNLDLSHNQIVQYVAGWQTNIHSVTALLTNNNPSTCALGDSSITQTGYFKPMTCDCAAGTWWYGFAFCLTQQPVRNCSVSGALTSRREESRQR